MFRNHVIQICWQAFEALVYGGNFIEMKPIFILYCNFNRFATWDGSLSSSKCDQIDAPSHTFRLRYLSVINLQWQYRDDIFVQTACDKYPNKPSENNKLIWNRLQATACLSRLHTCSVKPRYACHSSQTFPNQFIILLRYSFTYNYNWPPLWKKFANYQMICYCRK